MLAFRQWTITPGNLGYSIVNNGLNEYAVVVRHCAFIHCRRHIPSIRAGLL